MILAGLLAALFVAIVLRLYKMQVLNADAYQAKADAKSTKTITLTGMRGTIYDSNMIPLAYDKRSYNVQFYRDPSKSGDADRKMYTEVIINTIRLIESNGKSTIDEFWLRRDDDGKWIFDTGTTSESVAAKRESQWRSNFYETKTPVEDLFDKLCDKYFIPEDMDEAMKIKVLAIWQASRMYNYSSRPVTIAYDVDFETVSEIEVRSRDLTGVSISESSTRVYPLKNVASHTIGYIAKINNNDLENYLEQGYSNDALVGVTGIEYSMEDQLSPYIEYRRGEQVVQINTRGSVVRELSYTAPMDGNSIVLTIDSALTAKMSEFLQANIEAINAEQHDIVATNDKWNRTNAEILADYAERGKEISYANTGAMVAMDPNTGRVLGMVSYPDYDLSIFEGAEVDPGLWSEIAVDERNPMFNRVISAKDTPGSIFKLVTSLGGLSEGVLTPTETITDMGEYVNEGTDTSYHPKCWISASNRYQHANQTIVQGISNSCNYFFYEVGYRLGSAALTKWAAALGLTSKTNIELPSESTSFVGNQDMLYDKERAIEDQYTYKPIIAANMIKQMIYRVGADRGIEYDEELVNTATKSLLDLVITEGTKENWYAPIREILMYDLKLPSAYIANHLMVNEIVSYLNDLRWTPTETIMCAIGQSITQVTPIAVARYASAIANGGTVYDAQIVDKIVAADGTVVLEKQPVIANQIATNPEYYALIQQGMQNVTSGENNGTAAEAFKKAKYKIAAKTGTSQRTDLDIENNSWLITYAPVEDPQIVVVVYIQNGYAGARSADAAINTIEYYLDNLQKTEVSSAADEYSMAD